MFGPRPDRILSCISALALGAAASGLAAGAASATAGTAGVERLEALCEADGTSATTCACLSAFVETRFTPREIDGAVMILADSAASSDPGAALMALTNAGYEMGEIMSVINRVIELEEVAQSQCAEPVTADGSVDAPAQAEPSGAAPSE